MFFKQWSTCLMLNERKFYEIDWCGTCSKIWFLIARRYSRWKTYRERFEWSFSKANFTDRTWELFFSMNLIVVCVLNTRIKRSSDRCSLMNIEFHTGRTAIRILLFGNISMKLSNLQPLFRIDSNRFEFISIDSFLRPRFSFARENVVVYRNWIFWSNNWWE